MAVLRRRFPRERRGGTPLPRTGKPVREPADRRLAAGRCRPEAVDLSHAVAGAGRVDRGELVAQGGDEVPLGTGHAARSAAGDAPGRPPGTSGAPARSPPGGPASYPG